ncbi:MAG: hypothetical protein Q9194_005233 [Teloschistes cf. exilis]
MRYTSTFSALSAPSLLAVSTIFTVALAIEPKHHPFLKRQGCTNIDSQCSSVGSSLSSCIDYVCKSCTGVDPSIAQCCQRSTNSAIANCIEVNLDSSLDSSSTSIRGGGSATSRASFPTTTRATLPAFQTTSDSLSILTNPGCSSLESKIEECQSSTPNILGGLWSTQASCFCYSGSSYMPSSFDNYYSSCLKYLGTANLNLYSSIQIGTNRAISTPCAAIGDVQDISTSRGSNAGGGGRATATSGPTPTSSSGSNPVSTGASAGDSGSGGASSSATGFQAIRTTGEHKEHGFLPALPSRHSLLAKAMAYPIDSTSLKWINSLDGRAPRSPRVRTIIRKQAMVKAAAARKRRPKYATWNVPYLPASWTVLEHLPQMVEPHIPEPTPAAIETEDQDQACPVETTTVARTPPQPSVNAVRRAEDGTWTSWIPGNLSSTGYEAARIRYDFDVLALSALTTLHIGRATAERLHDKPTRLSDLLRSKKWSYFDFLPARYGQTQCLDEAICCVAARVRQWVSNYSEPNPICLDLYSRAVKSLQAALDDPLQRLQPNVLAATQVLAIFELLDEERQHAWHLHAEGAATLIRLRGPEAYQTDFEKALFVAQVGPIYTESILKLSRCFLQKPQWQALLGSVMNEFARVSSCGAVILAMWPCIGEIPGLFHSVRRIVSGVRISPAGQSQILARLMSLRSRLMEWGNNNNCSTTMLIGRQHFNHLLPHLPESEVEYEVRGLWAGSLMMLERLIVSLDPVKSGVMEAHAQQLAVEILTLKRQAYLNKPGAGLSLALKVMTAKAVLLTAEAWGHEISQEAVGRTISKDSFERWVIWSCPRTVAEYFKIKYPQVNKALWPWMAETGPEKTFGVPDRHLEEYHRMLAESRDTNVETFASQECFFGMMFCRE